MERTDVQRAARALYDDLEYASRHVSRLRALGAQCASVERDLDRLLESVAVLMHEEDCCDD